jgi:hypothetical protein
MTTEHRNIMNEVPLSMEISTKPLVDWKNPPTLEALKQDFTDAKSSHDYQKTKINTWLDNLNVTGAAKIETPKGNSQIVPKLIRKQAEWRYAALSEPFLSTQDVFNVSPVTWEDREAAMQNQLVLNHQFNNLVDKTRFIDEYVRTAVDEGTVIVRVGWEFQEEEYEGVFPVVEYRINPEVAPLHEHLAQMKESSPSQYATDVPEELKQAHELTMEQQQPIEAVVIGQKKEKRMRTVRNAPTLEVCDFRNVLIDPTCMGDMRKANFVIYHFESSLSELEKDGKYKNLDQISVADNSPLGAPDHTSSDGFRSFNFSDQPRKKIVVYEYWGFWDIDKTGMVEPIVAAWVGNTLIRMEKNPYPDKAIPFVVEQYLPVRKSIYGEPDGALLEDNQKIIGAVTRGMIDVMGKSANGQTGVRKDALDTTNRRKFDKGQDYEFNANVDPRQAIYMHTFPEIPNSAQFMLQLQNMEAESLTGVKSFSNGISGQGLGDVAAGVRGALDAASKRELGILRRLSSGIVKIGRKIISMNAEFLSDEEVIRITNEQFIKVRRDDLQGQFDLKLSISTAEEDNNKAEQLAFMLQTIGNNIDPSMSKMILSDIARLRKMPELAEKIENFEPQPDPLAQKRAELEIALLEAQVNAENAKAQRDMAQAQFNGAKVGTEQAKANNISSDTDLKNLNFVEQEKGVKQERDLQLRAEQANSQAQLKIMDNKVKEDGYKYDLLKHYLSSKQKKDSV